jgi:hypothetical protein
MPTLPGGQFRPDKPELSTGISQKVEGGILGASVNANLASQQDAVNAGANLGAGQKGARRRTKRRKHRRGGGNVSSLAVPTAHSISGSSSDGVQKAGIDVLNKLKVAGMYDKTANMQPYQVNGGFRMRRSENELPGGRRKRGRKTKRHGSSKKRNNRRNRSKRRSRSRGVRNRV